MFKLIIILLFGLTIAHHQSWTAIQRADSDMKITFSIILKTQNSNLLTYFLEKISDPDSELYGQYLTLDEIGSLISIDENIRNNLDNINNMFNFDCTFLYDAYLCTSYVSNINTIFNTDLYIYENTNGRRVIRSNVNYILPNEYIKYNIVEFVEGLSNNLFPLANIKYSINNNILVDPRYVGQESVRMMYNITENVNSNSNIIVAAWEFMEGGFVQSYVNRSQIGNGVKPKNVVVLAGSIGMDDTETELDLDEIANFGNITVAYGDSNGWIISGTLQIQNLTQSTRPNIVSISYGWNVYEQCQVITCNHTTSLQYVARADNELKKLGLLGISVLVSSGDAGSKGRTDEFCSTNQLNPDYPGSSPFVTSVGATFNTLNSKKYNFTTPLCLNNSCSTCEINATVPVSFDYVRWTTGGGFAEQNVSNWQIKYTSEYVKSGVYLPNDTWNVYGRGYPDVVMNGHNCPTFMTKFNMVDGTSCSSPMFAGFVALLNSHQVKNKQPTLGWLNPLLYKLATNYNNIFTPSGNGHTYCTEFTCCTPNNGFQTPPKQTVWNPVYGLGQPNFGNFVDALDDIFM